MRSLPGVGLLAAVVVFAVDLLSKWAITGPLNIDALPYGEARTITTFFDLRFVSNCGVSLGLLRADSVLARLGLIALTGTISIGVLVWMIRERNRVEQAALGLVFGGALGNIADRVLPPGFLGKTSDSLIAYPGCVIDFADLHFGGWRPFLVFNVADAAITAGVIVLVARALFVRDKPEAEKVNA